MTSRRTSTWVALACTLACVSGLPVVPAVLAQSPTDAASPRQDVLTGMFTWWNQAITEPDGFTQEAFARWFTPDAELIINGKLSAQGLAGLSEHFRKIQAVTHSVRIVLPFRDSFSSADGNRVFTYHFIRSVSPSGPACMRAMGYADLRNGKIAVIHLTRAQEPVPGGDPACSP